MLGAEFHPLLDEKQLECEEQGGTQTETHGMNWRRSFLENSASYCLVLFLANH